MSSLKLSQSHLPQAHSQESDSNRTGILNVAEMLLHGVADHEILDVWLYRINCQELVGNFIESGYDVPTLSRTTPQDLTAIGITDPSKRQKILSEIKKLNLQDGIPNFKPASLSHLLSLIKLDKFYYKSLCDQNIDTLEKLCQLTWEDFEELGITKLGHQKRLQLAIERLKNLDDENSAKPVSEPIYDTNPSQILLVASTENHSNNGPIINKQSSTSELSSTGSGSLHSVYSSTSYQHGNYAALQQRAPDSKSLSSVTYNMPNHNPSQTTQHRLQQNPPPPQQQQQTIYGYAKAPIISPIIAYSLPQPSNQNLNQHQMLQTALPHNSFNESKSKPSHNFNMICQNDQYYPIPSTQNRQSLCQLPFSALSNLPKHQQQLLQQSSIYATLSRCPGKPRQPPPVPTRKDSLKTASLMEYMDKRKTLDNAKACSSNSQILMNKRRMNSQVTLTKNKSFSGNAHMEASRMRFLHDNIRNKSVLHPAQVTNHTESRTNSLQDDMIYGLPASQNYTDQPQVPNNFDCVSLNELGQVYRRMNQNPNQISGSASSVIRFSPAHNSCATESSNMKNSTCSEGGGYLSEASSINSLVLTSTSTSTSTAKPENNHLPTSLRESNSSENSSNYNSGSSQTLYNSASSGSNDQILDVCSSATGETRQDQDNHRRSPSKQPSNNVPQGMFNSCPVINRSDCNATTGRDDNFPPPPSPLSELDEHDLASFNQDNNFSEINRGMMAFRIGI